ncbi:hypothetical protein C8N32_101358 [Rhodovulum imhoffii]|uniref:Uncharacterized protein n=1 Tax=Rhodovulum imhoffii TaxID=365340 RepID=A0A2T5BX00_9RHOB|nr:hypothetical protein C8N32_101358 [Rhodovulum imhoffii]
MPFFFEAATLSRMRSPITSRSNWAIRHHAAQLAAHDLVGQRIERAARLPAQPTMGQFLDAVAQPKLEVAAAGVRRALPEDGLPLLLQFGHRHRLHRRQFGQDVDPLRLACGRGLRA